ITVGEVIYGALRSQRAERLMDRLDREVWPNYRILDFDLQAAREYGRLRAELEARGVSVAEPDLRIAAIATARGLGVVTRKTPDTSSMFRGLRWRTGCLGGHGQSRSGRGRRAPGAGPGAAPVRAADGGAGGAGLRRAGAGHRRPAGRALLPRAALRSAPARLA